MKKSKPKKEDIVVFAFKKGSQTRIEDTISKVISEKYDKLTYFKLKNLKENL